MGRVPGFAFNSRSPPEDTGFTVKEGIGVQPLRRGLRTVGRSGITLGPNRTRSTRLQSKGGDPQVRVYEPSESLHHRNSSVPPERAIARPRTGCFLLPTTSSGTWPMS